MRRQSRRLATQAFITANSQLTASTEAERFLNENRAYLDNVGDINDVVHTLKRLTTEIHPKIAHRYADDPTRRYILSAGGTFLLSLAAACGYVRNRGNMKMLDGALDKLTAELDKPGDDPLNLEEYQRALASVTSSRGKAIRRLVNDTFLRFFNGATARLEWLDTASQITGWLRVPKWGAGGQLATLPLPPSWHDGCHRHKARHLFATASEDVWGNTGAAFAVPTGPQLPFG